MRLALIRREEVNGLGEFAENRAALRLVEETGSDN